MIGIELSMGLIKADLIMAKQGIEQYRNCNIKQIKNLVAYHLQQAAEKLIKIQIYQSGKDYDNRELYVHNLTRLINYADQLDFDFNVPQSIRDNALTITDWEASGRYDMHFSVRITSLENYYEKIEAWYQQVWKRGIR